MAYRVYQNGKEIEGKLVADFLDENHAGVFESMRAYNGKVFLLEDHLARLFDSGRTIGLKIFPNRGTLRREIRLALKTSGEKNTSVRLTLAGGKLFIIIGSRECPEAFYQKGICLKTASLPRGNSNAFPYQVKASAYQQAVLASAGPDASRVFDWVFLDQGNYLAETRVGNFFLVKRRKGASATLLTPPEHLILNGVTRKFVIKCTRELGFQVLETPLTRHDFYNADEAFLTNTSWEILPVRELDARAIGVQVPGPITLKLHHCLKRRIQEDVASHHSPGTHQRFR